MRDLMREMREDARELLIIRPLKESGRHIKFSAVARAEVANVDLFLSA